MEISVIAAVIITISGLMYKLKQDYGEYYDKKLSLIFMAGIWLTITFCVGALFGADYLSANKDVSSNYNLYKMVQNIAISAFIAMVPWFVIFSLPLKKSRKELD
ncbi:TPA: hypothetical protein RI762_003421 [Vibrio cholerae]|uniref:hypothetical protein n=1 Tax=Vibrio cholerae TaxID=666 RepID=UPI002853B65A|nr:hypothetical protein [Vibrio cholerae]HDV5438747.1 hypothetical protein [Vibrio cholerae]HDV5461144.1 hypothetical protein [Vibrio cholerae]HDV5472050.1 hypothetical protein [Vibrio cholerae]HDV5542260.1 hypothetical protein [Vibrio cholerae]